MHGSLPQISSFPQAAFLQVSGPVVSLLSSNHETKFQIRPILQASFQAQPNDFSSALSLVYRPTTSSRVSTSSRMIWGDFMGSIQDDVESGRYAIWDDVDIRTIWSLKLSIQAVYLDFFPEHRLLSVNVALLIASEKKRNIQLVLPWIPCKS